MQLKKGGFTLVEVMISLGLISIFVVMVITYSSVLSKNSNMSRSNNTNSRILAGVRDLAGMPASLRVSMRASSNGVVINPELLACAGGNPVNNCWTGVEVPFTLYSPVIQRSNTGAVMGALPISAPLGSSKPMRIDTFGAPCTVAGPGCPLLVSTSFKAQCGPPPVAVAPPPGSTVDLAPMDRCTVADVIEVTYHVRLDPNVANADPELSTFVTPITGSVVVPVVAISGNVPQ